VGAAWPRLATSVAPRLYSPPPLPALSLSHAPPPLCSGIREAKGNKANDTVETVARCLLFRPTYALQVRRALSRHLHI